ncbi:multicopper oxidase domain-containing protein [Halomonas sp. BC04]|uniref:multicopper oxidase domain-containing protein n=1 Tax=Halomonas sp. BC04 TaxID=1403540 RepID=UPI0022AFE660|nr:multicopper oxidase domain-containing protein [Halomonas sp. BC04]
MVIQVCRQVWRWAGPRRRVELLLHQRQVISHDPAIRVQEGDVLRMRLFAATIPVAFHLHGHDMLVTHKDGTPLPEPYEADVVGMQPGERYDVIVHMDNPGLWMTHDHIDHHTTNDGREHGGSMLVVEYEEIEKPEWYEWKEIEHQPDFYMIESMRKPFGLHDIPVHRGRDLM